MSILLGTTETSGKTLVAGGSPATLTGNKPSDVVDGDYILAVLAVDNSGSAEAGFTTPGTGWEEISVVEVPTSSPRPPLAAWYKKAASEGSTYDFQVAEAVGSLGNSLLMLAHVTGADATTFLSGTPVSGGVNNTVSPSTPSMTTADDNACVVSVVANNAGSLNLTADDSNGPSGMTVVYLRASGSSTSNTTIGIAFAEQVVAGETGTKQWTNAFAVNGVFSTLTFAIKPASGGASAVPRFTALRMMLNNN